MVGAMLVPPNKRMKLTKLSAAPLPGDAASCPRRPGRTRAPLRSLSAVLCRLGSGAVRTEGTRPSHPTAVELQRRPRRHVGLVCVAQCWRRRAVRDGPRGKVATGQAGGRSSVSGGRTAGSLARSAAQVHVDGVRRRRSCRAVGQTGLLTCIWADSVLQAGGVSVTLRTGSLARFFLWKCGDRAAQQADEADEPRGGTRMARRRCRRVRPMARWRGAPARSLSAVLCRLGSGAVRTEGTRPSHPTAVELQRRPRRHVGLVCVAQCWRRRAVRDGPRGKVATGQAGGRSSVSGGRTAGSLARSAAQVHADGVRRRRSIRMGTDFQPVAAHAKHITPTGFNLHIVDMAGRDAIQRQGQVIVNRIRCRG